MTPGARTASPARRVGTALVVIVVTLTAVTISLRVANRSTPVRTWWIGNLTISIGLGLMGAALTRVVPRNPIGWLFLVGAVGQGVTGAGREWAVYSVATNPGSLPLPDWTAWFGTWTSTFALGSLPLILLHFPDGRLPSPRWRALRAGIVVTIVLSATAEALMPGVFTEDLPQLVNPVGVQLPHMVDVVSVLWIVQLVLMAPAAASLVIRWRGASPGLRSQLQWVACAGVLLTTEAVLESLPFGDNGVFVLLSPLCLTLFLLSIALAVLRHHLWDVDVLVNVSLVYGSLTALIGVAFIGVVTVTGRWVDHGTTVWPTLIALAVLALAISPLRARVQQLVDHILYAGQRDPYRVLTVLSERLDNPDEPEVVLREAVEAVAAASLRMDHVAITRAQDGSVISVGHARTDPEVLPLVHDGVLVGSLQYAVRPGPPMGRAARARLVDLAARLALVVHAVDVSDAVRRSRQALAAAREEERRRVRRDLHDGLGPAMAAAALKVDAARMMIDREPGRAKEVLAQLGNDVREAIADVRRLVYDLQPPVLDSAGLLPALADKVNAFTAVAEDDRALRVELVAPKTLGELPARLELAAYRIVCEALTNVTRHADATRCRVTVRRSGPTLELTIDDNGRGLAEPVQVGIGTASMIERAMALGGRCHLGRSPMGGTRVEVRLPLGGTHEHWRDFSEPSLSDVRAPRLVGPPEPEPARLQATP